MLITKVHSFRIAVSTISAGVCGGENVIFLLMGGSHLGFALIAVRFNAFLLGSVLPIAPSFTTGLAVEHKNNIFFSAARFLATKIILICHP